MSCVRELAAQELLDQVAHGAAGNPKTGMFDDNPAAVAAGGREIAVGHRACGEAVGGEREVEPTGRYRNLSRGV
jgi:hypothetical protein